MTRAGNLMGGGRWGRNEEEERLDSQAPSLRAGGWGHAALLPLTGSPCVSGETEASRGQKLALLHTRGQHRWLGICSHGEGQVTDSSA